MFDGCTTDIVRGDRKLQTLVPAIRELRPRCGQEDDITTDPQYFIATNTLKDRRITAVLIRRNSVLEACVLFFEHCKFGFGLGLLRGGDAVGDGLVVGPEAFRVQYVHIGVQALLRSWRIHDVSLTVKFPVDHCIQCMGPPDTYRMFSAKITKRTLLMKQTYQETLSSMGPRTRRSLAGKRRQMEVRARVNFFPSLDATQTLEAMLILQPRSMVDRVAGFYHARYHLLHDNPDFFSMAIGLRDGTWLSVLSGWRRGLVTYVDLQMNDLHYKKESLSAVMRAFMLEHEIQRGQQSITFIGGTSLLLERYCEPIDISTEVFVSRPGLRATLFRRLMPRLRPGNIYDRVKVATIEESLNTARLSL